MLTDLELDDALDSLPGERVTAEYMQSRIAEVTSTILNGTTTTLVNIQLDNGYCVQGFSACVDPANFNEEIGQKIAYDNAFRELWPLFGFLLSEGRYRREAGAKVSAERFAERFGGTKGVA
jgi:hypothetical protein